MSMSFVIVRRDDTGDEEQACWITLVQLVEDLSGLSFGVGLNKF